MTIAMSDIHIISLINITFLHTLTGYVKLNLFDQNCTFLKDVMVEITFQTTF